MSHQITIVTGNKKKLEECIDILGSEFNDKVFLHLILSYWI